MPQNRAATLPTPKANPLVLAPVPLPTPGPSQVLIRVRALAINPVDAGVQAYAFAWNDCYPLTLGCDIAGEVVSVGGPRDGPTPNSSGLASASARQKSFSPGDRVIACVERGAWAEYVVAEDVLVARVPDRVGLAEAVVLPLCITTAASSLFEKKNMGLRHPRLARGIEGAEGSGEIVVVWGAASVVGSCAVQMLRAAGYLVAATASARNEGYALGLGADWVFDYKKEGVEGDIIRALEGKGRSAGVFAAVLDEGAVRSCAKIADGLGGRKVVGTVAPSSMPYKFEVPDGVRLGICNCTADILPNSEGGKAWGAPKMDVPSEVPVAIWDSWLTEALESGLMRCKPEPNVVGRGLESLQAGLDLMAKGVSASKIVVEID